VKAALERALLVFWEQSYEGQSTAAKRSPSLAARLSATSSCPCARTLRPSLSQERSRGQVRDERCAQRETSGGAMETGVNEVTAIRPIAGGTGVSRAWSEAAVPVRKVVFEEAFAVDVGGCSAVAQCRPPPKGATSQNGTGMTSKPSRWSCSIWLPHSLRRTPSFRRDSACSWTATGCKVPLVVGGCHVVPLDDVDTGFQDHSVESSQLMGWLDQACVCGDNACRTREPGPGEALSGATLGGADQRAPGSGR
jgi:hypothetical protein